jgi:tetratricopeptide (TPR) repeat protein|tara:strand:+ start:298 stop:1398 length:1101 start_codon:yes stop_codon:yes gene_type:complete
MRIFLLLLFSSVAIADPFALKQEGNLMRLQGNYAGAQQVYEQLVTRYPEDAIGYVFNLNTMLTLLTWDRNQTRFDDQIRQDAASTFDICERTISNDVSNYLAYYYCGQAHMTMSYLSAIRGEYYQSGRHANLAIKQLERTLKLNENLVDAKMHLGIAYYHADNLPPFLKALSWFLWFIPTGNAHKSLPYLEATTKHGYFFKDVAKFLYADLLIMEGDLQKASDLLEPLSRTYPGNSRVRLRYISLLLEQALYEETISVGQQFLSEQHQDIDKDLVRLWITRAHLARNAVDKARDTFKTINLKIDQNDDLPPWGLHWLLLTRGQIADLDNRRNDAVQNYQLIIDDDHYVNPVILTMARKGIASPFRQ